MLIIQIKALLPKKKLQELNEKMLNLIQNHINSLKLPMYDTMF